MRPFPNHLILLALALGLSACPPGPGAQSDPDSDPSAPVDATVEAQDQDNNNAAVDASDATAAPSYCNPDKTALMSYDPFQKKYLTQPCDLAQGERCVKPKNGPAKCALVKTSCVSKNTIKFTFGSGAGKDEWTEGCNYLEDIECALNFPDAPWKCAQLDDYLNYFCVTPAGEAAQCAKAEGSCIGPKTVQYSYKDVAWTTACPIHKPFCSDGTCLPFSAECKDSDDDPEDGNEFTKIDIVEEKSTKTVVINDEEKQIPISTVKKTILDNSHEKFGWVTVGETSYQDVCKDGKFLVEQICEEKTMTIKEGVELESATSLMNCSKTFVNGGPAFVSVCTTIVPGTLAVDCSNYGINYACIVDHCGPISEKESYDPPDTPADACNPDVEKCGPYIPPFDCAAPFEEVAQLFPDSQIEGQPGLWHVSTCSTPKNLYKNKWVTHLICYDIDPEEPGTELLTDTVKCGEGGACQSGLCNGEIPKYCVATFEEESDIDPLKPGFSETGYGEIVTQHLVSTCSGIKHVRYPLCEFKEPLTYWSNFVQCPKGHICVTSTDGASCKPTEVCQEDDDTITLTAGGTSIPLSDYCWGDKAPGKQGTTETIDWKCTPDEEKFNPNPVLACPAGTACCTHKFKGVGCHVDCPKDPPPPDPIAMAFNCDEPSDSDQDPTLPGEVIIEGIAPFDPGVSEYHTIKDSCSGLYNIEQYYCKASSASGQFGEGKALLLGSTGQVSCSQALADWGATLQPNEIGMCKTDPATGSGICFIHKKEEPPPPEVGSALECDESSDPDNDPYIPGHVTIKDGNQFKTKEDYCVGDIAVIQYECGVDESSKPIWVAVPAINCPKGCAQGKCCLLGSLDINFNLSVCMEDL